MSRLAERTIHALDISDNLLARLHYIAQHGCRIAVLHDKNNAKLLETVTKKFPDVTAELPPLLITAAKEKSEDLDTFYQAFVDAYEWKDLALGALTELASSVTHMAFISNPYLTQHFFDLMLAYIQVHLLIPQISERKIILLLFSKAKHDTQLPKITQFVHECDSAGKKLQDDFRKIAKQLGESLALLKDFMIKSSSIQSLRKEGILSISLNSLQIAMPSQEPFQTQFMSVYKYPLWIVYGFMFALDELALPDALNILKLALQTNFVFPVYRETVFFPHAEFDNLFEKYKGNFKLKKEKKYITDALAFAVTQGGKSHKERRVYVRQELSTLLSLLKSNPGLLGPKFQVVIGALAMAKDEIFGYFRSFVNQPPKGAGKYRDEDFKEVRIIELIYLAENVMALVRKYKRIVQMYYIEYLAGADLLALQDLANQNSSKLGQAANLLQEIMSEISSLSLDNFVAGTEYNLRNVRLNWLRVEMLISSSSAPAPVDSLRELTQRCNIMIQHTRFVDSIDEILQTTASLKQLWYFKDSLFATYEVAITEQSHLLYTSSFFRLLSQFTENAIALVPYELEGIGKECLDMSKKYLTLTVARVVHNFNEVLKKYLEFDSQLTETNAAFPVLQKAKMEKNFLTPVTPGVESEFAKKPELEGLRNYERSIAQLCISMNEIISIPISDVLLTPREYLRDSLYENIQTYFLKLLMDGADLQRPTIILRHLNIHCHLLKWLENYIDINTVDIIRQLMVSSSSHRLLVPGRIEWITEDELEGDPVIIRQLVQWFSEFLTKKLLSSKDNNVTVYSPIRKAFLSLPHKRSEKIAEWSELRALAFLIGPYGFKLLEREAFKVIINSVSGIKELLQSNRAILEELAKNCLKEQYPAESLKKFKDLDLIMQRSIVVGSALQFRKILHEALLSVCKERIPNIHENLNICFNQYRRNILGIQELMPLDMLAADCGIDVDAADGALKIALSKSVGSADSTIWDLLPIAYAVGFTSKIWSEAVFKPSLEVFSNNAQVLLDAIYYLIIDTKAITNANVGEREVIQLLTDFIEMSSNILLKNARMQRTGINLTSAFVFLDKFVDRSSLLITRDQLEAVIPYALIRPYFQDAYAVQDDDQ